MKIKKDIEVDLDEDFVEEQEDTRNRVGVYFKIKELNTDSTEWKTLSPTLEPLENVAVKLECLEDEVSKGKIDGEDYIVLTQKGFVEMLLKYAYEIIKTNKGKGVNYG